MDALDLKPVLCVCVCVGYPFTLKCHIHFHPFKKPQPFLVIYLHDIFCKPKFRFKPFKPVEAMASFSLCVSGIVNYCVV